MTNVRYLLKVLTAIALGSVALWVIVVIAVEIVLALMGGSGVQGD